MLDRAVTRLEKKIEHGADYFISQPVYTKEKIVEIYEATKHLQAPIYIGIMPVTSYKSAEFLHHEVPGIKLSEDALTRMKTCEKIKKRQNWKDCYCQRISRSGYAIFQWDLPYYTIFTLRCDTRVDEIYRAIG